MDKINFFPDNFNVQNQTIILRLDLNVPIKDKIITDDTRISLCLPFINKLIEKKAKIIIISHLGRPKGMRDPSLSLSPIYKYLKNNIALNNLEQQIKTYHVALGENKKTVLSLLPFTIFSCWFIS